MTYVPRALVLSSHPDSSKTTGEWVGSHSFGEDSYPVTNTSYIAPTSATGLYTLWYNSATYPTNGSYSAGHHFYYSNGSWYDGEATFAPHQITNTDVWVNQTSCADAEYIYIWASASQCRGRFLSPEFSVINNHSSGFQGAGSITKTSDTTLRIVVDKNSPSSSSAVTYVVQLDGVTQGPGINHTQNATTHFVQNLTYAPGVWKLWKQGSSGDLLLAEFNGGKKVHCNFW